LPNITIDGRGLTPKEAVQDMGKRMEPLTSRGYHPISEVEILDTKTRKVIEHFQVTDSEFALHMQPEKAQAGSGKATPKEHKPPMHHEYPYVARLTLEG